MTKIEDLMDLDMLFAKSTRVLTWRARMKLYAQSLWYPWPLRQFEVLDEDNRIVIGGWTHDNGTIYITYIRELA